MSDWFHGLGPDDQPSVILFSPYVRARTTAQAVLDRLDRRSTDRRGRRRAPAREEFGILDRLTPLGIRDK
jgi:phosphohistidine phosphatase SixA